MNANGLPEFKVLVKYLHSFAKGLCNWKIERFYYNPCEFYHLSNSITLHLVDNFFLMIRYLKIKVGLLPMDAFLFFEYWVREKCLQHWRRVLWTLIFLLLKTLSKLLDASINFINRKILKVEHFLPSCKTTKKVYFCSVEFHRLT